MTLQFHLIIRQLTRKTADVPNPNNYNWVISTNKNINNKTLKHPHVFYLSFYNFGSTTDEFNTHYINLTNPTTTTSSKTSTTSTPTSTPTESLTKPAPAAATTTGAGTISDADSGGLSSSTKVGLGIGIGVGIPLLIIIGALIGWRLAASRRKRSSSPVQTNAPLMSSDSPRGPPPAAGYRDAYPQREPSPKPGDAYNGYYAPAHELPDRFPAGQEVPGSQGVFHELPNESAGGR